MDFVWHFLLGALVSFILSIVMSRKYRNEQRTRYGFMWFQYRKLDWVHKYVGDYLYVCERVPYLDDKLDRLPNESKY